MAKKKAAAQKTAAKKKVAKVSKGGVIYWPDDDCQVCTLGFDASGLDMSRPLPRPVVATLTPVKGGEDGDLKTWPDGSGTPYMTITLTEK